MPRKRYGMMFCVAALGQLSADSCMEILHGARASRPSKDPSKDASISGRKCHFGKKRIFLGQLSGTSLEHTYPQHRMFSLHVLE